MAVLLANNEPFDETAWIGNLPQAYRDWNDALAEFFFPEGAIGRPAYLAVDGDTLAEIAQLHGWPSGTAERDFAAAINHAVRNAGYHRVLGHAPDEAEHRSYSYRWCEHQAGRSAVPPFIGLLGLTVLAASNMHEGHGISMNNYYRRLTELLPDHYYVQQDYPRVVDGWRALNHWLDVTHRDRRGKSTARPTNHLTRTWLCPLTVPTPRARSSAVARLLSVGQPRAQ